MDFIGYMKRFLKFTCVGGMGTGIHFGILYGLTSAGLIYWGSAIIAIVIAMSYNYTLNNFWTFSDKRKHGKDYFKGLGKYAMVSFIGDGMYLGSMVLLTEKAHLFYLLSAAISMFSIMIIRYLVIRRLIWRTASV
jgi:dolichol-phosphate mannosyltransferase